MSEKRQFSFASLVTAGVITVISITLVLFLLGSTFLIWFAGNGFSSYLKESMGISIELSENMSETSIKKLQANLESNPYIKTVVYKSKEDIKQDLIEDLGRDPEEVLGYDPSKSYFDIFIKSNYMNPDSLPIVEKSLRGKNFTSTMFYNKEDIANANKNMSMIISVLLILAIILILISVILIRSIIQLNIYSKRFLINTMQLVGATNRFIRKPFVTRMVGCGIIAAILANAGITGIIYYIKGIISIEASFITQQDVLIVYLLVFVFGIIIPAFATASTVNKYLKMTTNKIYRA